jgi:histone H3/H4
MPPKKRSIKRKDYDWKVGLSDAAVQRLANKAGVVAMSAGTYDRVKETIMSFVQEVLRVAYIATKHAGRKRISTRDMVRGIKHSDVPFAMEALSTGKEEELKRCKTYEATHKTSKALNRVRFYQKQSECVQFAKEGFDRTVRLIAEGLIRDDASFTSNAMALLQVTAEDMVVRMLKLANQLAIHAGRRTVRGNDMDIAYTICRMF